MNTYTIELHTIDGAKKLNAVALTYEEDIDIIKDVMLLMLNQF